MMVRYDVSCNKDGEQSWVSSDTGGWVKAKDALALEAELAKLKTYLATGIKASTKPMPLLKPAIAGQPRHNPILDAVSTKEI